MKKVNRHNGPWVREESGKRHRIEIHTECDGYSHREMVLRVEYDQHGRTVTFATMLKPDWTRKCDDSCLNWKVQLEEGD